jgi:methylmalonyl-CoA/ethylmalonyl-CoA epimerase
MKKDFEVEGVDHIGIVTDGSHNLFSLLKDILGMSFLGTEKISDQKTEVSVFRSGCSSALELLEPMSSDSIVARYREKNQKGIHHLALRVKGLESAIAHLVSKGVVMIDREPRLGHGGSKIAFIHPRYTSGILVELVE